MHDFVHAYLVVFRIQCGEWIQNMWNCMHSVQEKGEPGKIPICLAVFLGVVVVGNLVVLNLFLALLLDSIKSDELTGDKKKRKIMVKLLKALKKVFYSNLLAKKLRKITPYYKSYDVKTKNHIEELQNLEDFNPDLSKTSLKNIVNKIELTENERTVIDIKDDAIKNNDIEGCKDSLNICETLGKDAEKNSLSISSAVDNIPKHVHNKITIKEKLSITIEKLYNQKKPSKPTSSFRQKLLSIRPKMKKVVTSKTFEYIIIFFVLFSSAILVFDNVELEAKDDSDPLKQALDNLDKIFAVIFILEMILKWIGLGVRKYFKDSWNRLDFFIVVVSVLSLIMHENNAIGNLRVLRSLRAFRPLRAMSRFHGIKVVTNALFKSIPSIINVFFICIIFWFIFAIMGVNLFGGKMYSCQWKETGKKVWHYKDFERYPNLSKHYYPAPINVTTKEQCEKLANVTGQKVEWKNLLINFDNTAIAYVSLLQVATFKGWMPIMQAAVDSPEKINEQPIRDNNIFNYFYFVVFIIFGSFFTLNLFISVVIDNFNQQQQKYELEGTELFLSDSQKKMYNSLKNLKGKIPKKLLPIPKAQWRERLYLIVTGDKFEIAVLVITTLNLFVMAVEYEGMEQRYQLVIDYINYGFVIVFGIEIAIRIIAMGKVYFYVPWNCFDFILVTISIVLNISSVVYVTLGGERLPASNWFPILRMVRVVRVLRVARVANGIRTLLFALVLSAPALFNVGGLLFLIMFIYAVFGMSLFGNIEQNGVINDILNFKTFPSAFLLLFQASTSAGWDGFMAPTLYTNQIDYPCSGKSCMSSAFYGYAYFISYLLITFVIVTNMYIAIILENFEQATKDKEENVTSDDFEHFFDMWQRFDKNGNGRLDVYQLSEFLHALDEPFKVRQPNLQEIAAMKIPLNEDHELFLIDVVKAVIKKILGEEYFTDELEKELFENFQKYAKKIELDNKRRISDTQIYVFEMFNPSQAQQMHLKKSSGTYEKLDETIIELSNSFTPIEMKKLDKENYLLQSIKETNDTEKNYSMVTSEKNVPMNDETNTIQAEIHCTWPK